MENDLQALLMVEKHDATLAEVDETIRKEILDRRRRYDRNNAVEDKMLVSILYLSNSSTMTTIPKSFLGREFKKSKSMTKEDLVTKAPLTL